jgi:hypothetical protein
MARISPFGLLRVAALPIGPLLELAPHATTRHIDAALAALERMESLRAPLEDALHAAVPSNGPPVRSALLEIRRSVHNGRSPRLGARQLTGALAVLPDDSREILSDWLAQQLACTESLAAAQAFYEREVLEHVRPSLWALTTGESFLRPLALASLELFNEWARDAGRPSGRLSATRTERSLLLYATRAAAKTSPFSIFMHQALVDLTDPAAGLPRPDPQDRDSRSYLNRGLLIQMYHEAAAKAGEAACRFRLNRSITWRADGSVEALAPEYVIFSQRLLRLGRPRSFRLHPALAARLARLPSRFDLAELRQALLDGGLSAEAAARFLLQLRERGLVLPEACASGYDENPEEGCREALGACGEPAWGAVGAALHALSKAAKALASAPARSRALLLESSRAQIESTWRVLGRLPEDKPLALFWEDGFFRRPLGPLGGGINGLLQELAATLRPDAVVTAPYRVLCDFFVATHGPGGVCHDVPTFLAQASNALARIQWWSADPARLELPTRADAKIACTALVQLSAPDEETLAAGGGALVLNQVYPGCGWLSARHAFGESEYQRELRRALTEWLAAVCAPTEPIDLLLSGDCNPLQAHPKLTPRVLGWPIEPSRGFEAAVVPISRISLCHDPASGLLDVADADGNPLMPVYLGTTVPHPAWGAEFWLTTLAQPYRIRRPMEELMPPLDSALEHLALPRRTVGRVILNRASWWMRSSRLRRLWYRHTDARRLLDVAADCRALGMPRRLFIRGARTAIGAAGDAHKPLWIDTRNPFSLEILLPLLGRTEWLHISEALPDLPIWPQLAGRPHVAELLVEMVV